MHYLEEYKLFMQAKLVKHAQEIDNDELTVRGLSYRTQPSRALDYLFELDREQLVTIDGWYLDDTNAFATDDPHTPPIQDNNYCGLGKKFYETLQHNDADFIAYVVRKDQIAELNLDTNPFRERILNHLAFLVTINAGQIKKLRAKTSAYLALYAKDKLAPARGIDHRAYYSHQRSREQFLAYAYRHCFLQKLNPLNVRVWSNAFDWNSDTNEGKVRFVELMLLMEREGFVEILHWDSSGHALVNFAKDPIEKLSDNRIKTEAAKIDSILEQKKEKGKHINDEGEPARLISRDSRGAYYYDGKRIDVPSYPVYFRIFDIVYTKSDSTGFVSYEDIEKHLTSPESAPFIAPPAKDTKTRNRRVNNAISNTTAGFFRYAKVNGKRLENHTLDARKLIEIVRGKGLRLNNPTV